MFWSVVTVIVSELIIIAFLIPAIAGVLFIFEVAHSASEERHERAGETARKALAYRYEKASGSMCPWEPHRAR